MKRTLEVTPISPLFGKSTNGLAKVEPKNLEFLRNICGTNLEKDMGLSLVQADEDGKIVQANGALKHIKIRLQDKD